MKSSSAENLVQEGVQEQRQNDGTGVQSSNCFMLVYNCCSTLVSMCTSCFCFTSDETLEPDISAPETLDIHASSDKEDKKSLPERRPVLLKNSTLVKGNSFVSDLAANLINYFRQPHSVEVLPPLPRSVDENIGNNLRFENTHNSNPDEIVNMKYPIQESTPASSAATEDQMSDGIGSDEGAGYQLPKEIHDQSTFSSSNQMGDVDMLASSRRTQNQPSHVGNVVAMAQNYNVYVSNSDTFNIRPPEIEEVLVTEDVIEYGEWIREFFKTLAAQEYVFLHESSHMSGNAYNVAIKAAQHIRLTAGLPMHQITAKMLLRTAKWMANQTSKISRLERTNKAGVSSRRSGTICTICHQREVNVMFVPCRHTVSCYPCSKEIVFCPGCRESITEVQPF